MKRKLVDTRSSKVHWLTALGCAVLLLAASGAWLAWKGGHSALAARPKPSHSARQAPAPATTGQQLAAAAGEDDRYVAGERQLYLVDANVRIQVGAADPDTSYDLSGHGELALTVVTRDLETVVVRGELIGFNPSLHSSTVEVSPPLETLSQPFWVTLSLRGEVKSVAIHPDLVGVWHGLLRTIIATSQFVSPGREEAALGRWSVEETDQLGRYRAEYVRLLPGVFSKTKGPYSHIELSKEVLRGSGPKLSSKTELQVDGRGLVQRAEALESTSVPLGQTPLLSTTRVKLVLKSIERGERGTDEAWTSSRSPLYANRGTPESPASELERKRKLVAGADFATLSTALRGFAPGSEERWGAIERLGALFDLEPEALTDAARLLRGRISADDARGIMAALGESTTGQAQQVLTEVAKNDALEGETRSVALTHLNLNPAPTESTLTELAGLADSSQDSNVRDRAVLALGGAAGGALKHSDTADAGERAVETLKSGAAAASDDASRQLYLGALGNTGASSALDLLKRQLGDSNPETRSAALMALRFIQEPEVDTILAQFMLQDPALIARQAAVGAAGYRATAAPIIQACQQILRADPLEAMRFEVLRTLGEKLLVAGQQQLIAWLASEDPSTAVRERASGLLGRPAE
jgi:hypothetical protein